MTILSRILFGALLSYELLNLVGILHHPLDFTWLGLVITSLGVWLLVELLMGRARHFHPKFPYGWAMLLAFLATFADAIGDMERLYTHVPHYDKYLHFAGGMAVGALVFVTIWAVASASKYPKLHMTRGWSALFAFTVATFLGVLYEMEEFFEDVFTGSHRLGDGFDTASDIFLDMVGAALAIFLFTRYLAYRRRKATLRSKGQK